MIIHWNSNKVFRFFVHNNSILETPQKLCKNNGKKRYKLDKFKTKIIYSGDDNFFSSHSEHTS